MVQFVMFAVAGAALLVYISVLTIKQYLALKEFKGPFVAGFTRLWLLRANSSGEMNRAFTHINDEYGMLARTLPRQTLKVQPHNSFQHCVALPPGSQNDHLFMLETIVLTTYQAPLLGSLRTCSLQRILSWSSG